MATPFHLPVTAAQVGTYFVGQYYQVLQHQPDYVHQFYSDASTMLRVDGNTRDTATSMLHIHALIMSLNYSAIEIKTAHSLESWNGGVLVMVSGSVHVKDFNRRRKFVQTFFLAPQEKGYFVLNDIFHFVDDEQIVQHPVTYLAQSNLESQLNASTAIREQVPNYATGGDIQAREFAPASAKLEENGPIDSYGFSEEQLQNVSEADDILEEDYGVQSNGSLQSSMKPLQDPLPVPVEDTVGEPQKHTYASILAKGQTAQAVPQSFNKAATPSSEWQHVAEPPSQPSISPDDAVERPGMDTFEEASAVEEEVEVKSVYVRNVPTTMAASEIEEEFKKFGKLKPDGVAIRTRKDIDICYAFVEFEDIAGVQNAIKASTVQIAGHQLYIEGRRPNRGIPIRGRGRGRGRISYYPAEGARGRFGSRGYGRANGQDTNDRDYNRSRGNGFYRQPRQERIFSGYQQGSRNGQNSSE
ncbi:hypothetical protein M9H77_35748 [Catharanthus roseus]|uniref:Uncharacterized protein n=1 Tax=Catharanthus roseus TaxID=4058 RepID=A0ACB9ZQ75_CATRO|nr:hypothetical protein M9H77_35748 [Catharanthus roseus]